MKLFKGLLRERTRASVLQTITFNAPGTYYPPYGKTTFEIQGRGTPGNPTTGGNYAGTNPEEPGNVSGYNPPTGGNYAGTNPETGGNYAGTNPTTGGNYAGTNPSTGGNYAGVNWSSFITNSYRNTTNNTWRSFYSGFSGSNPNCPTPSSGATANWQYSYQYDCTPRYNPVVPGNDYYNPVVPGNDYYNPIEPGNDYYNPVVPGDANYNPSVPGNDYYNPVEPGNSGAPANVLGVTLPGGASDSPAPVVGFLAISPVSFTNAGVAISVPPGGYVSIKNL